MSAIVERAYFIPMNFPATYVLDHYGLRVGILVGVSLEVTGYILKCFINQSFWFVIVGSP